MCVCVCVCVCVCGEGCTKQQQCFYGVNLFVEQKQIQMKNSHTCCASLKCTFAREKQR